MVCGRTRARRVLRVVLFAPLNDVAMGGSAVLLHTAGKKEQTLKMTVMETGCGRDTPPLSYASGLTLGEGTSTVTLAINPEYSTSKNSMCRT